MIFALFFPPQGDIHSDVAEMHISHHPPPPPPQMSSQERKQKWEQGQADYMGLDSFDNIEKRLDSFLKWKALRNRYSDLVLYFVQDMK